MRRGVTDQKPVNRGEAVILFGIGDHTFAISAAAVDEIRAMDGLQPIEAAEAGLVPKVRYRLLREGRTYYVVDGNFYFQMLPSAAKL